MLKSLDLTVLSPLLKTLFDTAESILAVTSASIAITNPLLE